SSAALTRRLLLVAVQGCESPHSPRDGAPRPRPPALPLALAGGRDAERRVAGAARVATEVLDDVLRGLRIAGGSSALQTCRLRFHLLGGALELRPLLPDFRLRLRLVGQRALWEERRDPGGVLRDDLRVCGNHRPVSGLCILLDVLPGVSVLLHYLLPFFDDFRRRFRLGGGQHGDQQSGHRNQGAEADRWAHRLFPFAMGRPERPCWRHCPCCPVLSRAYPAADPRRRTLDRRL